MSARAWLVTLCALVLGCEGAGGPGGTVARCVDRAQALSLDGAPLVLSLGEARTPGSCARGDRDADGVVQIDGAPGAGELVVRAVPDDPSEDLILAAHHNCGDASSVTSCSDHAPGVTGAEQIVIVRSGRPTFLHVRTRSGRATTVTMTARERPVFGEGRACDPASAVPGCLDDPECEVADRCTARHTCRDGTCVPAAAGHSGACDEVISCSTSLACVEGRCVSIEGAPCDAPPSYCSVRLGLVCIDDVCRGSIARVGERCNEATPPMCEHPLSCEGEPGAEICVDRLGTVCDSPQRLVASRAGDPPVVTPITIDAADPSRHRSSCGHGDALPDRSFFVTGLTGTLHAVVRSTDGGPLPYLYVRGPGTCAEGLHACGALGRTVSEIGSGVPDLFLIVDGAGSHELEVYDAIAVAHGGVCSESDPYRVCEAGTECREGSCLALTQLEPSPCFCRPVSFGGPGQLMRARGALGPGEESWFALSPGSALRVAPRSACPVDLEVDVFDGDVPCAACDPALFRSLAAASVGDGTTCAPVELAFPGAAAMTSQLRLRLRSELGGAYELDVTMTP